ncbi:NeuD/PglB/VioB family sugar acetyltransferase [Enterococcus casseliflavus]|uniref:NeuD/PglB/VioB family sugar acetyltransferase n=1 Tax=Enterococcus casseliflavus TaxID=37734 RepID=UPI001432EDB9|nr:NeuD/PglB/VioB family sugar acetyltransferase [Enterococcus casseliflavus]NKD32799.1 sialic acid O-acetyltransferase NeuD family sugar O-acyltransferase [Enterococcus casseliflavus]
MELIIIGAGGFAKEIIFLVERNNFFTIKGLVDDNYQHLPEEILDYPVLGGIDYLNQIRKNTAIAIGVAKPKIKQMIYHKIKNNGNLFFPNIIDNTALIGREVSFGIGNIIMPYTTFTAHINFGNFNMVNIHSTIGHNSEINNYNSIYPDVNLSGNVRIGSHNEFGVGTKVIQNIKIGNDNITGAGSVVIRNIKDKMKLVGVPAKTIESWD